MGAVNEKYTACDYELDVFSDELVSVLVNLIYI